MSTLDELKGALRDTLAARGSLGQIQARVRAEIFNALEEAVSALPSSSMAPAPHPLFSCRAPSFAPTMSHDTPRPEPRREAGMHIACLVPADRIEPRGCDDAECGCVYGIRKPTFLSLYTQPSCRMSPATRRTPNRLCRTKTSSSMSLSGSTSSTTSTSTLSRCSSRRRVSRPSASTAPSVSLSLQATLPSHPLSGG